MENIIIRGAGIKDLEQLEIISKQTFTEAFGVENSRENMTKYIKENLSEEKLAAELKNNKSEFYFAFFEGEVIGYLKLNFAQAQTDIQHEHSMEIERIYVLQQFQDKKVGQKLLEKAIQRAKQNNADYIWLGVWENNVGAIRFYRKNGFAEFDKHPFKLGDDIQTDIMMKLEMTG